MWRNGLWISRNLIFPQQGMWKSAKLCTLACGKKTVAALREKAVFHINLYYHCYYYLKTFIHIYSFII